MDTLLIARKHIEVRFSEVDSLGIVWHGNYLKYFEDGREEFARKYGINYLYLHSQGIVMPIVKLDVSYKKSLKYGDFAMVETTFVETPAAKLIFNYKITDVQGKEVICTGQTTQVFVDKNGNMLFKIPDFLQSWKDRFFPNTTSR